MLTTLYFRPDATHIQIEAHISIGKTRKGYTRGTFNETMPPPLIKAADNLRYATYISYGYVAANFWGGCDNI